MTVAWQLDASAARLVDRTIAGQIDLLRPNDGLSVRLAGNPPLRILGLARGDQGPLDSSQVEAYVRGADLVATYDELPPRNLRAQVYWRRLHSADFASSGSSRINAAFDFIVSVNTSLLDTDPQASIRAQLPACAEALSLNRSGRFEMLPFLAKGRTLTSVESAGCLLIRLVGGRFSYVEMVHPLDFNRTTIECQTAAATRVDLSHQLFQERLEKGVILRARLRAAVLATENDESTAQAAYCHFATAEPPLTV